MSGVQIFIRGTIIAVAALIILTGCNSSITDTETQPMPNLMKRQDLTSNMTIFEFLSDAMQRNGKFPINLVVDKTYYQQNEIKRGDIVYIELPEAIETKNVELESKEALRVVALPKETVSINQGQVSLNRKNLDTFYGKEYYGEQVQDKSKAETMKQDVKLSNDHFFVLADQWWRSAYSSNIIGAIPKDYIKGKIVGYVD